jgi:hypothetical protein
LIAGRIRIVCNPIQAIRCMPHDKPSTAASCRRQSSPAQPVSSRQDRTLRSSSRGHRRLTRGSKQQLAMGRECGYGGQIKENLSTAVIRQDISIAQM